MKNFKFLFVAFSFILAVFSGAVIGAAVDVSPGLVAGIAGGASLFSIGIPDGVLFMGMPGMRPTRASEKIMSTAGRQGQNNISQQQGATRMIWDSLTITAGKLYYRFFEGVNTRTFPWTNLTDNKLEAGESLAIQYMYFNIVKYTTATSKYVVASATDEILLGTLNIELMNQIVMKPIRIMSFDPNFNRQPNSASGSFKTYTNPVILPLVPFVFGVQLPDVPIAGAGEVWTLQLTVEGTGSLLASKNTL